MVAEGNNELLLAFAFGDDRSTSLFSGPVDCNVGVDLTSISEVADSFTTQGNGSGIGDV